MAQSGVAKLFRNGASQAVRLPAEFRFEGTEVYISRDEETGDVVLSTRPGAKAWAEFFRIDPSEGPDSAFLPEFMSDRPMNRVPVDKNLFPLDDES
jgi:antitoxin VapB